MSSSQHLKGSSERHTELLENDGNVIINWIINYIIILIICVISYNCLLWRYHYSTDSYLQIFDMAPYWHLQLGRYLNFGLTLLVEKLGLNTVLHQRLFLCIWVLATAAAICIIEHTFESMANHQVSSAWRLVTSCAVSIAFINVFYLELILFPEMALFLAVAELSLSLAISVFFMPGFYSKVLSLLFLAIAIGGYQSLVGYYVAFVLCGLLCKLWKDKNVKSAVHESLLCCGISVFVSLFDIVLVKLLIRIGTIVDSGRGASLTLSTVVSNLMTILQYQKRLLMNADGLLIGPWFAVFACILAILLLYRSLFARWRDRIVLVLTVVASLLFAYSAHIVEANVELTHRSNIAVWAVLAAYSCFLLTTDDSITIRSTMPRRFDGYLVLTVSVFVLLLFNVLSIQDIAVDSYASNYIDRMIAEQIDVKLDKYEEETGNEVKYIAVTRDVNTTYSYPETRYHGSQLGVRILQVDYSYWCLIDYITNRQLVSIEMSEEDKARLFSNSDWERLDLDEQLVIEGDTAYLALF